MAIRNDFGVDGQGPMAVEAAYEGILPPAPPANPNAPAALHVAQNTASTPPVVITIALEDGNIARLPADTDITNVRANGADLEFVQPDGTVIVITGGSIANLALFVGDIQIPAETVELMFNTAGIEPAAGPEGGEPDGTGSYVDIGQQTVGQGFRQNSLLVDTDFGSASVDDADEATDGQRPKITIGDGTYTIADDGLFDGNREDGFSDSSVATGTFTATDAQPMTLAVNPPAGTFYSSGHEIVWDATDPLHLVGYYEIPGEHGPVRVTVVTFDLDVTETVSGGVYTAAATWTMTLEQPLDHSLATADDLLFMPFTVTVSDGFNPPSVATFNMAVEDDEPWLNRDEIGEIAGDRAQHGNVDEDGLEGGQEGGHGDDPSGGASFVGQLNILWGADRGDGPDDSETGRQDGAEDGSDDNASLTGRAVYFTDADVGVEYDTEGEGNGDGEPIPQLLAMPDLYSRGEKVYFKLDESGTKLIGYVPGEEQVGEEGPTTFVEASGDRDVLWVTLSDDGTGTYTLVLKDVLDHPIANTEDDITLTFRFTARDFDGDTVTGDFTVTIDDDTPTETSSSVTAGGRADENDLSNFNPLAAGLEIFDDIFNTNLFANLPSYLRVVGSNGTSPGDQGDGSVTGLLGTVPVWGTLNDLVNPGADGEGEFHLAGDTAAKAWLDDLDLESDGSPVTKVESVEIAGLGKAMGFFAEDGRLVFGLFVGEGGVYNFRLFDQIDHEGGTPATTDTLELDFSGLITFTDADGDTIGLSAGRFVIDVIDDVPVLRAALNLSVDEADLSNFNPLAALVLAADDHDGDPLGGIFHMLPPYLRIVGSNGTDQTPTGALDALLGTASTSGFINSALIGGVDVVDGGADEFGHFALKSDADATALLNQLGPNGTVYSNGDAINSVETFEVDIGPSHLTLMGFFASDGRLVFTVTVTSEGAYDIRLFDQIDHKTGTTPNNSLALDIGQFVTYTDADGDAIDLADHINLTVVDDIPELSGTVAVTLDEAHLNTAGNLAALLLRIRGSTGTDPEASDIIDQFFGTSGATGLLNNPIGTQVVVGADDAGKFALVSASTAEAYITTLELTSKGGAINNVEMLDLGDYGQVMGFFVGSGFTARLVFTLTVSEEGVYDIRLADQIDHKVDGNWVDELAIDLGPLVTYVDSDGDPVAGGGTLAGHFSLKIVDDQPVADINLRSDRFVTLDETKGAVAGDPNAGDEVGRSNPPAFSAFGALIGYAQTTTSGGSSIFTDNAVTGADESLTKSYALQIDTAEPTGLKDAVTDADVYLEKDANGNVIGRFGPAANQVVFAITIDSSNGTIKVYQYRALEHDDINDSDEAQALAEIMASNALFIEQTVKDYDQDVSTDRVDLGSILRFEDDGPKVTIDGATTVAENVTATGAWTPPTSTDGIVSLTIAINGGEPTNIVFDSGVATFPAGNGGVLTLNSNGTWSLKAGVNYDNSDEAADQVVFTIAAEDGDGDTSTATQTVVITDGADISVTVGQTSLTVEESDLDPTQAGNDLVRGAATGTTPSGDSESAQNSGITFTAGTDDITVALVADPVPTISGLDPAYTVTWAIVGGQLVGTLHNGGDDLGAVIYVGLTNTTATVGNSVTPLITVTLSDAFQHAVGTADITINGITLSATDQDLGSKTATVSVTVVDDKPVIITSPSTTNLIQNADFQDGEWTFRGWGHDATTVTDWVLEAAPTGAGNVVLDRIESPYGGVSSTDGSDMIDLAATPGNIAISQTVEGTEAGKTYTLNFEYGASQPSSAGLAVYWNNVLIGTYSPSAGVMTQVTIVVVGTGNSDTIKFVETGSGPDATGTYLSNIRMYAATAGVVDEDALTSNPLNNGGPGDVVAGLTAEGELGILWGADDGSARDVTFPDSLETGPTGLFSGGQPVTFDVTDNGHTLIAKAGNQPVFTVTIDPSSAHGTYRFTLEGRLDHPLHGVEDNLPVTLGFAARDADGDTVNGSFTVIVNDDTPVAVHNDSVTVSEDAQAHGNVMSNDAPGADGATLTKVTFNPSDPVPTWENIDQVNGSSITRPEGVYSFEPDGEWTFDPIPNYNGPAGFAYIITDGDGDESDPEVAVEYPVVITTTPVPDAPVLTVVEDQVDYIESIHPNMDQLNQNVFANSDFAITDPDSPTTTYSKIELTTELNSGNLLFVRQAYANAPSANDPDGMNLQLNNGFANFTTSQSSTGTLIITPKDGVPFTADKVEAILKKIIFHTDESVFASETHKVFIKVTDTEGNTSSALEMTIDATGTNDRPFFSGTTPTIGASEDVPLILGTAYAANQVVAQDRDADGPVRVSLSVEHGTLAVNLAPNVTIVPGSQGPRTVTLEGSLADINAMLHATGSTGNIVYTSDSNYNGPDKLKLIINDLGDQLLDPESTTKTIDINVAAINDAPTAQDVDLSVVESGYAVDDTSPTAGNPSTSLLNFPVGDIDNTAAQLSISGVKLGGPSSSNSYETDGEIQGVYGKLFWNSTAKTYEYVLDNNLAATQALNQDETVAETFTYQVTDGDLTGTATIEIAVTGTNDKPIATADAIKLVPAGWSYLADNGHIYQFVQTPQLTSWDAAKTQAQGLINGNSYLATVTSANEQTVVLAVTTTGGVTHAIAYLGGQQTDTSPEPAAGWYWVTGPDAPQPFEAGYTNWYQGGGSDNEPNNNGVGGISEEVLTMYGAFRSGGWNDANGAQHWAGGGFTYGFVAEAGGFNALYAPVNEDDPYTFSSALLLQNDKKVDSGETLSVTGLGETGQSSITTANGSIVSFSGGNITFTAGPSYQSLGVGQVGTDTFKYTITDGQGRTSWAEVTIEIAGVNDAPSAPETFSKSISEAGDVFGVDEAGRTIRFEPQDFNRDSEVDALFDSGKTVAEVLTELTTTLGHSEVQAFAILWDYLDDRYVTDGHTQPDVNEAFVRLGIEYGWYLKAGKPPFDEVIAKYTEGERSQSLHDNLLGNLTDGPLTSRFDSTLSGVLKGAVDAIGFATSLRFRDYFEGNPGESHAEETLYDRTNLLVHYTTGDFSATDPEQASGTLEWSGSAESTLGWLTVDADGSWRYELKPGAADSLGVGDSTTDTFTVTVTDNANATDTATLTITILGSNDAPVITGSTPVAYVAPELAGFTEESPTNVDFEPVTSRDSDIITALTNNGVNMDGALSALSANRAQAIGLMWDYLDDGYVMGPTNPGINEAFIRLGIEYAKYLLAGNAPLTSTIGKYTPDNDSNGSPDRLQNLHDNLLGNLRYASMSQVGRFSGDFVKLAEFAAAMKAAHVDDLLVRPYFEGNQNSTNNSLLWDQQHGYLALQSGQLNATDVDGDAVSFSIAAGSTPTYGTFVVNANGTWTYTLNHSPVTLNLPAGQAATDSIVVVASDGKGGFDTHTLTVNFTGQNDLPVSADAFDTILEDGSKTFSPADFAFFDPDTGDGLKAVRIDTLPAEGMLKLNGVDVVAGQVIAAALIGQLVYTPPANANGAAYATFAFSVQDNSDAFDAVRNTYTINVTAVNDAPVLAGLEGQTFDENIVNTPNFYRLIDGDVSLSDVDSANFGGGNVTVTYSSGGGAEDYLTIRDPHSPQPITVVDDEVFYNGVLIGTMTGGNAGADLVIALTAAATPAAVEAMIENLGYHNSSDTPTETRTISVTVNDGDGGTSLAQTAVINVTAQNDAPVATDDVASTSEYVPVSINVLANDTDPDSPALHVTQVNGQAISLGNPVTIAGVGTVSLLADGSLSYNPMGQLGLAENVTGTATFSYTVSDGTATDTGSVNVTVTGGDFPAATPDGQVWVYDASNTLIAVYGSGPGTAPGGVPYFENIRPINAAVDSLTAPNHTVVVGAGQYQTNGIQIQLDQDGTKIYGNQFGEDPRPSAGSDRVSGDTVNESVINGAGAPQIFKIQGSNVEINGFDLKGSSEGSADIITSDQPNDSGALIRFNMVSGGSDDGIRLHNHADGVIEYNYVFGNANDGINVTGDENNANALISTGNIIRFNEVSGTNATANDNGAIYVYNSQNTTINNNYVHDYVGEAGIVLGTRKGTGNPERNGGTIQDNIVVNSGKDGIDVFQSDVVVKGNTVQNSGGWGLAIGIDYADLSAGTPKPDNVDVFNNTFENNNLVRNVPPSGSTPEAGPVRVVNGATDIYFDNNNLYGGSGTNMIAGTTGNDNIDGKAGADTIIFSGGSDTITDANLDAAVDKLIVRGGTGNDTVTIGNAVGPSTSLEVTYGSAVSTVSGIEEIEFIGGGGVDTLTVTGDLGLTGVSQSTIRFTGDEGTDTVDVSGRTSAHRVVADGGADADTAKLGIVFNTATFTPIMSGATLIGVEITHTIAGEPVTDRFTNFESFEFANGVTLTLPELFNQAPTQVALTNVVALVEGDAVGTGILVANIVVTDPDNYGTNNLSLAGTDAALFEIRGTELYYVGPTPDFETKSSFDVTVRVDDPLLGSGPDASTSATIAVTDVNEAPTALAFANVTASLAEDANTTAATKVADIVVTDDALGTEAFTLTGTDADKFEVVGSVLYLKAGAVLDFETNPSLDVTVTATDLTLPGSPVAQSFSLDVTDVDEAPPNLPPVVTDETIYLRQTDDSFFDIPVAALLRNDADPEGKSLKVTAVSGTNASLSADGLTVTFKVVGAANTATADFTYTVWDGNNSVQATAHVVKVTTLTPTASSNFHIDASAAGQHIVGLGGSDILIAATSGGSNVYGGAQAAADGTLGDDMLFGSNTQADNMYGGDGKDTLYGRAGADTLNGEDGDDTLVGGSGNDVFNGGAGFDTVDYSQDGGTQGVVVNLNTSSWDPDGATPAVGARSAKDTFGNTDTFGSASPTGIERIVGTEQTDYINGVNNSSVNETLDGRGGADFIFGNGGDDTLLGGDGADWLDGGGNNDVLYGGAGNDTLIGGNGEDRFVFAESGAANKDTITDYVFHSNPNNGDRVDLSALLDTAFNSGDSVNDFVRVTNAGGTTLTIQVDTDGAGTGQGWTDVADLTNGNTGSADSVRIFFDGVDHVISD